MHKCYKLKKFIILVCITLMRIGLYCITLMGIGGNVLNCNMKILMVLEICFILFIDYIIAFEMMK